MAFPQIPQMTRGELAEEWTDERVTSLRIRRARSEGQSPLFCLERLDGTRLLSSSYSS